MTTVGLVGGLGPESTIDYYRRILETWAQLEGSTSPSIVIDSLDVRRALHLVGADLARAGKIDDAVVQWRQLSGALARSEPVPACWLLWRIGSLLDAQARAAAASERAGHRAGHPRCRQCP